MPLQQPDQPTNERPRQMGQFWTVLGTVVGLISLIALIELSPRLSASQESPFLAGDQVPSVVVSNDGYLRVTDVNIVCFAMDMKIAGNTFGFVMVGNGSPPQKKLAPTESYTVSCAPGRFIVAPTSAISQIEVGIVAYYRPWPFTFLQCRKFFRFVGQNDGTKLNWFKQPPNDTGKKFDDFVRQTGTQFP